MIYAKIKIHRRVGGIDMEFLKNIQKDTLLIAPSNMKRKVLEELDSLNTLITIKMMSFRELLEKLDFSYNEETLLYLSKTYNVKPHTAKIYIKNLYYLKDQETDDIQVRKLQEMKKDLQAKKLIDTDLLFIEYLKEQNILFYGYDYYTKEEKKLIEELQKITNVEVYMENSVTEKQLIVYPFQTIEEEIESVVAEMVTLIQSGVSYNQIKLADLPNEYYYPLKKFARLYHLPIELPKKISLYETEIGKEIIKKLKDEVPVEEIIAERRAVNSEEEELELFIKIINKYPFVSLEDVLPFIVEEMKNTYLKEEQLQNRIEIIPLKNQFITKDDYVFLLGFNNGNFPKIIKDEDFISDKTKKELGFTTSEERNKEEKVALMKKLFAMNHIWISYKLETYSETYYPSTLITDYQMMEEQYQKQTNTHYSVLYDRIKLASMLDKYILYNEKEKDLEIYYSNLAIPYRTYDHRYQNVNINELKEYINQKLTLSYSSLNHFYLCKFQYYLQDILKINKFESTLSTAIGNIFHKVLSLAWKEGFNFEKEYNEACKEYETSEKNKFYFQKLKKELSFIIQTIHEQNRITGFNEALFEERITVKQNTSFPVYFTGIVDKILWRQENHKKLVSIIDYKTGSPDLDLRLMPFGLNLQLPTYMYLIANSEKFQNSQVCGIYLQKILNTKTVNSKDIEKDKKDSLKLTGYSIDNEYYLSIWDPTYEKSEVIKSLKKTANGWYTYAKILNEEEMNQVIKLTDRKIKEGIKNILEADFTINPKKIKGEKIGCKYCKFKDICYHTEKDVVELVPEKDLSFLKNIE